MRNSYVVPMRWMVIYEYEIPGGALDLSFTKLPRPWSPWEASPSRTNFHGRTGNRTRYLIISSQKLWPLDHEAGLVLIIVKPEMHTWWSLDPLFLKLPIFKNVLISPQCQIFFPSEPLWLMYRLNLLLNKMLHISRQTYGNRHWRNPSQLNGKIFPVLNNYQALKAQPLQILTLDAPEWWFTRLDHREKTPLPI
jgi:hypothetical protein